MVYCQDNPHTLVMLKNISLLDFLEQYPSSGVRAMFPNFYFVHEPEVYKKHKRTLEAMINQTTHVSAMVNEFCELAYCYYDDWEREI